MLPMCYAVALTSNVNSKKKHGLQHGVHLQHRSLQHSCQLQQSTHIRQYKQDNITAVSMH
jgi:hypothetical protein